MKLALLPLALTGVFSLLASPYANADTTINVPISGSYINTDPGNLTIISTGAVGNQLTNSVSMIGLYNDGVLGTGTGASSYALLNNSTIQTLSNTGVIHGQGGGVDNTIGAVIGTLSNSGTISANDTVILNFGTIGTLTNQGIINANSIAIGNTSGAVIGTLSNSGTINGYIGIINLGTINNISNNATIRANGTGIRNNDTIGTLTNQGTITAATAILEGSGGTIDVINNTGSIIGSSIGMSITGSLGTLNNSKLISGNYGVSNSGHIVTIYNSAGGTINGNSTGLHNSGTIDSLSNSGTVSASTISSSANGIYNTGTITSLTNTGLVNAYSAIGNSANGSITSLTNTTSGTITGAYSGIYNNGTIGALSNAGRIYGGIYGVSTQGNTDLLDNSGTITGGLAAIVATGSGTIGTLNNSGLITAATYAINIGSGAAIEILINTGTIAGPIVNLVSSALNITGGSGTIFGTLTGINGSIGNITSAAGLSFVGGNQLLNDNIDVGTSTATNSGVLQVNNPLTITGNYVQGSGSTLLIGVVNPVFNGNLTDTGYGRLVVNGNATLDDSSIMVKSVSYALAAGQRYVVVAASGPLSVSDVAYSASGFTETVTGTIQIDSSNSSYTDLVLTLGSSGPVNRATNRSSAAALRGLFNYSGTDAAMLAVFNPAAALDTAAAANQAGAQLSPEATANAVVRASTAAFDAVQSAAGNRLDSLRTAQAGGSGVATGEASLDPAVWGRIFGGQANQGERDGISGYHANYGGFLLGGDMQARPDWRIGGLFSYSHTNVGNDGDNSGSGASVNAYGLSAYAGFDGHPWYLNLTAGVARQLYGTSRTISYTGFSGIANGSFQGRVYSTGAEAGYRLAAGDATLTPLAGMRYSALKQDAYTETGGSGAALAVNGSSYSSLKSEVGARYERSLQTSHGELQPFVQLGWNHEFHDTALTTSASFAADSTGTTVFTAQGASPLRNTAVLSLGAALLQSKNLTLSARYTLEGAKGYTAQTGDLTLRWQY